MKEKKIIIQMKVTIDLTNEDLEDVLLYLPEKLTGFITEEDVILEDELYDEDIEILDEKGKTISIDEIINIQKQKQKNVNVAKDEFCKKWIPKNTSTHKEFIAELNKVIEQEKM